MKKIFKPIIVALLAAVARAVVRRYRPKIVMVTGSVGKTSTKDAVAAVLASRFYLAKSEKSFNTEFGVPFTILGVGSPWGNAFAWVKVLKSAAGLLILPNHYPDMLVLEVGADKPGDLARALKIVTPDAVVVTGLTKIPVHVEAYATPEAVREEEFSPAQALPPGAPLIIPADDPYALDLSARVPAHVITYGMAEEAQVRLADPHFCKEEERVVGMCVRVQIGGEQEAVTVRGSVGRTQLYPVGAAVAAALGFGIPLRDAVKAIEKEYVPPPGRGRLLSGIRGSFIIDDSYNASPAAVEEALKNLREFPAPAGGRRIAVLGDMLELGRYSVMEHERIGSLAREVADKVIAVGIRARAFGRGEGKAEVELCDNSRSAAEGLKTLVQEGDVVLIKGSQSIRMERIVEALLADPKDLPRLVRQEREWLKRS